MKNLIDQIEIDDLAIHLHKRYRHLIEERYQYENLKNHFNPPATITRPLVEQIRNYFLNYIYPEVDQRLLLNEAFAHLDNHFKNPGHLLRIFADTSTVVFKFGWQFPKALKTGLNTLKAYRSASEFEIAFLNEARDENLSPPVSIQQFKELIARLPKKAIYRFLEDFEALFTALTDTKLLTKTIGVMDEMIIKMSAHADVYDRKEIEAIRLGKEILSEGYDLFSTMGKNEKRELSDFIVYVEKKSLDQIYSRYSE